MARAWIDRLDSQAGWDEWPIPTRIEFERLRCEVERLRPSLASAEREAWLYAWLDLDPRLEVLGMGWRKDLAHLSEQTVRDEVRDEKLILIRSHGKVVTLLDMATAHLELQTQS